MTRLTKLLCGIAAMACLATTAKANILLYQNNFDGNEASDAGVLGAFAGLPTEAASGPAYWNAQGWAGNYGANRQVLDGPYAPSSGLHLTGLASHTTISASFILGFLESWDSFDGRCCAPDHLEILIDGVSVLDLTYNNALGSIKSIGGGTLLTDGMGNFSEYIQANGNTEYSDTLVNMGTSSALTFAHTGSTLDFEFRAGGAGWQGSNDEGYGIDNVVFTYDGVHVTDGVPEPATWALMIGGFGLAGTTLRRRRSVSAA